MNPSSPETHLEGSDCSPESSGFEIPEEIKETKETKPKRIRPGHATVLATKIMQAKAVASEMKRLKDRGIRFLPKGRLDKQTISMVNAWADKLNNSAKVSENFIIAGIDQAEDGVKSVKEFNTLKLQIKESSKLGLNNLPGLWPRKIWFNPQVAGELLKLAFALNRSISFTTHLVLLYGLEALAEELSTVGPHPPNQIDSPAKALAKNQSGENKGLSQEEKDKAFQERNKNFDPKKHLSNQPYIIKSLPECRGRTDSDKKEFR